MKKAFHYTLYCTSICCLFFLFLSCTKEVDVVGPQGPQGPQGVAGNSDNASGNIQGQIQLYDVNGNALTDNSGANVSIENTSPLINAISSQTGSFVLTAVHTGDYDIDIQKPGFGTMRLLNFQNPGGTKAAQTGILPVGQILDSIYNINLHIDTASTAGNYYLAITIKLAHPQTINNPVLLFFSDTSAVTNSSSLFTFRTKFFQQNDSTISYIGFDNRLSGVSDRLAVTKNLYITAALDNVQTISYTNEHGIAIYPCAGNLSNVVKVYNVLGN